MTPSYIRRVLVALAVGTLLLTACGGDSDGGDSDGGSSDDGGGEVAAATEATLEAREFSFAPNELTVAAASDVSITLDNKGAIPHNWSVLAQGVAISKEADFDEADVVAGIDEVAGGETGSTTVNLAAGEYQIICSIAGHLDAGMRGTLTVK